jgi:hypothetical protein
MADFREKRTTIQRGSYACQAGNRRLRPRTVGKSRASPEAEVDNHRLSDGRPCAGVHKPVNGTRICPARGLPDVEEARYEIRQASNTGKPVFYRFQKPADQRFPVMLELFCRAPDGITLAEGSHLTPIPLDEAVASLSAIGNDPPRRAKTTTYLSPQVYFLTIIF